MAYRLIKSLVFSLLLCSSVAFADTGVTPAPLDIRDASSTVITYPYRVYFPNGSVTDNGDYTTSINFVPTASLSSFYLKLDQTASQTVINGQPRFDLGTVQGASSVYWRFDTEVNALGTFPKLSARGYVNSSGYSPIGLIDSSSLALVNNVSNSQQLLFANLSSLSTDNAGIEYFFIPDSLFTINRNIVLKDIDSIGIPGRNLSLGDTTSQNNPELDIYGYSNPNHISVTHKFDANNYHISRNSANVSAMQLDMPLIIYDDSLSGGATLSYSNEILPYLKLNKPFFLDYTRTATITAPVDNTVKIWDIDAKFDQDWTEGGFDVHNWANNVVTTREGTFNFVNGITDDNVAGVFNTTNNASYSWTSGNHTVKNMGFIGTANDNATINSTQDATIEDTALAFVANTNINNVGAGRVNSTLTGLKLLLTATGSETNRSVYGIRIPSLPSSLGTGSVFAIYDQSGKPTQLGSDTTNFNFGTYAFSGLGTVPLLTFKSTGFPPGSYYGGMADALVVIERNILPQLGFVNDTATDNVFLQHLGNGTLELRTDCVGQNGGLYLDSSNSVNPVFRHYGFITGLGTDNYVQWQLSDVDDYFYLTRKDTNVQGFKVDMPFIGLNYGEFDGGILSVGSTLGFIVPSNTVGTRLMWLPDSSSFRAGTVGIADPTIWDHQNIGPVTFAFGQDVKATGAVAFIAGSTINSTANLNIGLGNNLNIRQNGCIVIGQNSTADTGVDQTLIGWTNAGHGTDNVLLGGGLTANGSNNTLVGTTFTWSGDNALALGVGAIDIFVPSVGDIQLNRSTDIDGNLTFLGNRTITANSGLLGSNGITIDTASVVTPTHFTGQLNFDTGNSSNGPSGGINIVTGSAGNTNQAGNVRITGGDAGSGIGAVGGGIILSSGVGTTNGEITLNSDKDNFTFLNGDFINFSEKSVIVATSTTLTFPEISVSTNSVFGIHILASESKIVALNTDISSSGLPSVATNNFVVGNYDSTAHTIEGVTLGYLLDASGSAFGYLDKNMKIYDPTIPQYMNIEAGNIKGSNITDSSLSVNSIPVASTSGLLVSYSDLNWDTTYGLKTKIPYGEMYGDDVSLTVNIASSSVYYAVPTGLSSGSLNGFTFASSALTALVPGKYLVNWSMSGMLAAGANNHIEGGVIINSTASSNAQAINVTHMLNTSDDQSISGNGILNIATSDVIRLGIENQSALNNVVVTHANMTVTRIDN